MASEKSFLIDIVSPERKILSGEAQFAVFPGIEGEFGVLPNHAPIVSVLAPGEMKIVQDKTAHYFAISGGFVEVSGNRVTVAADTCESPAEIDRDQAQSEKKAADEELQKATSTVIAGQAKTRLKTAEARLKVAAKAVAADLNKH